MNSQAPQFIRITMIKVIVKLTAIDTHYPNGREGFADDWDYPASEMSESGMVPLTSMNNFDEITDVLVEKNLVAGEHYAVADQSYGVITPCSGIEFREDDTYGYPAWYAYQSQGE